MNPRTLTLVVCLVGRPASAGVWTQLGSLPVPGLTAVCRTGHGSIVVASKQGSTSEVWVISRLGRSNAATDRRPSCLRRSGRLGTAYCTADLGCLCGRSRPARSD